MGISVRQRPGLIHSGFVGGGVDYRRGATSAFVDRLCEKTQALASSRGNGALIAIEYTDQRPHVATIFEASMAPYAGALWPRPHWPADKYES